MAVTATGTFRCIMYTPGSRLLDCRARSVVLPAHDGLRGILRDHCPMLCKLGLGIMQVRDGKSDQRQMDAVEYYLIDDGFARVSENNLTVLAYEVTSFRGMNHEDVDSLVAEATKMLHGDEYSRQFRHHDIEKAWQVVNLAKMAGYEPLGKVSGLK